MAVKLGLFQRVVLWVSGCVAVGEKRFERGSLPLYAVRCKRHGLFKDYPHGWDGYFTCPKCWEEDKR